MGKRGPKRKTMKRELNGRASRRLEDQAVQAMAKNSNLDLAAREILAPAVAARSRVHGVKVGLAVGQMAGSYVGRLRLSGGEDGKPTLGGDDRIANARYLAAETFAREREDWYRSMSGTIIPREPGAVNLNATRGAAASGEDVDRAIKVRQLYRASCAVIERKQEATTCGTPLTNPLTTALQWIVIEDREVPHMVPDLIIALDALVEHYGLLRSRALAHSRKAA